MPADHQMIYLVASCVAFVASLWFIASECRRRGDWLAAFAFIGGGLTIFYEPLADILASVFYPVQGQLTWIELVGRKVPVAVGILYFWYMSVPAVYAVRRAEQGLTRAALWRLYLFLFTAITFFEFYGSNIGVQFYYGPHPYVVFGAPLWCTASFSAFAVGTSICLYLISKLERQHHWLAIFGVPLSMAGTHMVVSLPTTLAMLTTTDPFWIWTGGTLTIALSLVLTHAASLVLCSDSAAMQKSRLAAGGAA